MMPQWLPFAALAFPASGDAGHVATAPVTLTRGDITGSIASARSRVHACPAGAGGIVEVHVTVAPSGHVARATVVSTPTKTLGRCVASAVKTIRFRATRRGRSFIYPFAFQDTRRLPTTAQVLAHIRRRYTSDLRRCHAAHAPAGHAGKVHVELRVAPSGHTAPSSVEGFNRSVERCIWRAIHRWRIPGTYETTEYAISMDLGRRPR